MRTVARTAYVSVMLLVAGVLLYVQMLVAMWAAAALPLAVGRVPVGEVLSDPWAYVAPGLCALLLALSLAALYARDMRGTPRVPADPG